MTQTHTTQEIYQKDIHYSEKSMVGMRDHQEDYSCIARLHSGNEILAVMSDGMGGHACGEVASKQAVETFVEGFNAYPGRSIAGKLAIALKQANNKLATTIREMPAMDGMGCTLVGMHVGPDGVNWISVGDSPLFVYRNGRLKQLNEDHSMRPKIAEALRSGKITPEEAASHPQRNALRSAVMGDELSLIDAPERPFPLQKGDILVLASDGIDVLSPGEIGAELKAGGAALQIAARLLSAVEMKRNPKQDNTSVQVVVVSEDSGVAFSAPRKWGFPISRFAAAKMVALVVVLTALIVYGVFFVQDFLADRKQVDKATEPKGALQVPAPIKPEASPVIPAVMPPETKASDQPSVNSKEVQDAPVVSKGEKKAAPSEKGQTVDQDGAPDSKDGKKKTPTGKDSKPDGKKAVADSKAKPAKPVSKPAPKVDSSKTAAPVESAVGEKEQQ